MSQGNSNANNNVTQQQQKSLWNNSRSARHFPPSQQQQQQQQQEFNDEMRARDFDYPAGRASASAASHSPLNEQHQQQHLYDLEQCGDDEEEDQNYANQLRRSQLQIAGQLQHHNNHQHQHQHSSHHKQSSSSRGQGNAQDQNHHRTQQQMHLVANNNYAKNQSASARVAAEATTGPIVIKSGSGDNTQQLHSPRESLHVNFNRSSQRGGQGGEEEEEGDGESTRKKKYLTAKYGQQQMNLIKKRLKIEMWLHEQLQLLASQSNSTIDVSSTPPLHLCTSAPLHLSPSSHLLLISNHSNCFISCPK